MTETYTSLISMTPVKLIKLCPTANRYVLDTLHFSLCMQDNKIEHTVGFNKGKKLLKVIRKHKIEGKILKLPRSGFENFLN